MNPERRNEEEKPREKRLQNTELRGRGWKKTLKKWLVRIRQIENKDSQHMHNWNT